MGTGQLRSRKAQDEVRTATQGEPRTSKRDLEFEEQGTPDYNQGKVSRQDKQTIHWLTYYLNINYAKTV